jgi:adenylate cyclase
MSIEIERKFLVCGEFRNHATSTNRIVQGYIFSSPESSVRVRVMGVKGYLTIKGKAGLTGIGRYEWEREIPLNEAEELLLLCRPGLIEKIRYIIPCGKHIIEVDEFHGNNDGLILAEVELSSEDEQFEKPSWLGKEVTDDPRFFNAALSVKPFSTW